ncbi:MAG TPA: hypothetical protein VEY67_06525 [Candidatus Dormibacteraeota bacterium]|nr:hypothetical protein [Candidatus Dormibacteraeota bacterium]
MVKVAWGDEPPPRGPRRYLWLLIVIGLVAGAIALLLVSGDLIPR